MGRALVVTALLAGCSFTPGTPLGAVADSGGDGQGSGSCTAWAQPPTDLDPCAVPAPTSGFELCAGGKHVYSTDTGELDGAAGPASALVDTLGPTPVRVVSLTELTVCAGTGLRVIGTHPVAFLVFGEVDVPGIIEASAWLDNSQIWQPGPGADLCTAGAGAQGTDSGDGAGGGGGAGYGRPGGTGGPRDSSTARAAGGGSEGNPEIMPLRGGCAGGRGGNDNGSVGGGLGGRGGGGIQIAAQGPVAIGGAVRASGGPGEGGTSNSGGGGGGGGGAGGAIVIEGATVTVTGWLCANGGSGGGGANDQGDDGQPGAIGTCTLAAAAGGAGAPSNGQAGGAGGFGSSDAGNGDGADEGAGGGGGAVGRIVVRSAGARTLGQMITPPAQ